MFVVYSKVKMILLLLFAGMVDAADAISQIQILLLGSK
jgi:hypothetical protein